MKVNIDKKYKLKSKILSLDNKLQQILLWSNICTLLACVETVFTIARIYSCLSGKHPALLVLTLTIIILLFAIYLYFKWKDSAAKNSDSVQKPINLNYQIGELNSQRKLISNYLLVYSLAIIITGMFFWQGIHDGLTPLFKSIAPLNFLIYSTGFYFMTQAARQKYKLEVLTKQIDRLA